MAGWKLGGLLAPIDREAHKGVTSRYSNKLKEIGLNRVRANECERIGAIPEAKLAKAFEETEREGVLNTVARELEQAKAELDHGEYKAMFADLPFGYDRGIKFRRIARCSKLVEHVPLLPPDWGTLSLLTRLIKLDAENGTTLFDDLLADGTINSAMARKAGYEFPDG
jgi:hypothetical protein